MDNPNSDVSRRVDSAAYNLDGQSTGNLPKPRMTNPRGNKNGDGMCLDRATLLSTQLYQMAINEEIPLTQDEMDRVSPDYLFVLAITKQIGLNQRDKDRLRPLHLAHLAVTGTIDLNQEDKARLPTELLFELFVQGILSLSEDERARFTAGQLEQLKELGTEYSESLVSL
jgi:hypothetical protein